MASTFLRLFQYAKAPDADPLENFTTEALAACIRADFRPMELALRQSGLLDWKVPRLTALVPHTQVHLPGAGVVDLALHAESPQGRLTYWVEIKVHSGLSGDQLWNYLQHAAEFPGEARPQVALLTRRRLDRLPGMRWVTAVRAEAVDGSGLSLGWLTWQQMQSAISASGTQAPYWHDFNSLLKETGMADGFDSPVSSREAASLSAAFALQRKAERIVLPFLAHAQVTMPEARWQKTEQDVQSCFARQFRQHGRFVVWNKGADAYVMAGVVDRNGEAYLLITVEMDPKRGADRTQILSQADLSGLSTAWRRQMDSWFVLVTERRLALFDTLEGASDWLKARLDDLHAAGVLAVLPKLGRSVPDKEPEVEEI
jgi:hypothetical protein